MPELPDITVYLEHLTRRIVPSTLDAMRIGSPFLLRTVDPPVSEVVGRAVVSLRRLGKRVVIELEGSLFVVIHLMISGRLRWESRGVKLPGKIGLAAFDFSTGTLILTEVSTRKRASLHLVRGEADLRAIDRGGLEVMDASLEAFRGPLLAEKHTLKRSLTDPRLFSGIGNAYSDEILHRARLSPVRQTHQLTDDEITRLYHATLSTLAEWTDRLRRETGERWPEKVTAFREEMAVHGRYGKPCPDCGSSVQRIAYAQNETNYCAQCQNGGRLLADRSLSRLLKSDWPRTLEELEELRDVRRGTTGGKGA